MLNALGAGQAGGMRGLSWIGAGGGALANPAVIPPPTPKATAEGQPTIPRPPRARRILVADDESLAGMSLMQSVKRLGYEALGPARDGEHAVELAYSTLPDLALMDARMATETDGLEASRAMFHELMLPVILTTAYTDREQVASAAEAGVFGYLVKPVTREQLGPAIEVAWSRFNEYIAKEIEVELLSRRLKDRSDLERAKWLLVEQRGLDETSAAAEIHRRARRDGVTVVEAARRILRE